MGQATTRKVIVQSLNVYEGLAKDHADSAAGATGELLALLLVSISSFKLPNLSGKSVQVVPKSACRTTVSKQSIRERRGQSKGRRYSRKERTMSIKLDIRQAAESTYFEAVYKRSSSARV